MTLLRGVWILLFFVGSALNLGALAGSKDTELGPLAPTPVPGERYYAPFPVSITLDGNLGDWAGVPRVELVKPFGTVGVTFAAAADSEFLYFAADVTDDSIIAGQHNTDFWNEDSVELYLNGTGDLTLRSYQDGVAQITIPALNIGLDPEETVIAGVRGTTVGAQVIVVETPAGYAVELAIPLIGDIWTIIPEHQAVIGFQVHLNSASVTNRDTKLIWSKLDVADGSYQNPSLFGQLEFFEIGNEVVSELDESTNASEVSLDPSINWDSREWELRWSDEFDGPSGTPVDSSKWVADIGGQGWGNNELEYYTDRVENAALDGDGNLAIVARKDESGDLRCHYGECDYTSARLVTRGKFEFTYGRVEARIRIPRGQGIWPAFWMLGTNLTSVGWPASGEIDILENIGKEPRTVHGTIHGPGYSGTHGIGSGISIEDDFADDFHVYAIDWDSDAIRWYMDGEMYFAITPGDLGGREWVFDHDFYLLLNVAVGGNWPGFPDSTTEFPQTMLVDYVRVYTLAGQGN